MDNRQRFNDAKQALELQKEMSDGKSDGGEISGLSDVSWVGTSSDSYL